MTQTKALQIAGIAGEVFGAFVVDFALIALKAWLLVLVLGWFGITALGFWKAAVAIILLQLIFTSAKGAKK
jgi:hypothetical protein